MATPSANRHRDLSFGLGSQQLKSAAVQDDVGEIPPSSCAHAPASTVKHGADMVVESAVRDSRQRLRLNVEETPTRGPSKFSQLNVAAKSQATEESVQMTPSSGAKPKGSVSLQDSSQRPGYPWPSCTLDVQVTPSRKASTGFKGTLPGARFDCTSVKGLTDVSAKNIELSSAPNTAGVSVYKSLGWDDDGDEFM